MANVNSTSGTSAADIFAAINGSSGKTGKSETDDMGDRFLTLLVTQLRNQDPLNPLDNNQMTSQLAQINTVKGIEQMNVTLNKLMAAYSNSQTMEAASVIGKYVLTAGGKIELGASGGVGGVKLGANADQVTVTITDSSGKVVQTENLGARNAGVFSFMWDGKDADGNALPAGNYKFSVEAKSGANKVDATALQLGMVSALTRSGSGFVLDLGANGTVSFDDVQQIL